MDERIARLQRMQRAEPSAYNLQALINELLRAGQISVHEAYWRITEAITVCQCTFRCEHHMGRGDRVYCKSCGGDGGEHLEDGWMPCYRCGTQGYETNAAGYCLNTLTPYTEIRITPNDEDLGIWLPNHLVDASFDPDAGVPHGYESEMAALAGKKICQQCDTYMQDFGVLIPADHADVRYWSPPQHEYAFEYDYDEHDPRFEDIVDPGCLCPQCYPHPERTTLIDFYRGETNG